MDSIGMWCYWLFVEIFVSGFVVEWDLWVMVLFVGWVWGC